MDQNPYFYVLPYSNFQYVVTACSLLHLVLNLNKISKYLLEGNIVMETNKMFYVHRHHIS